MMRYCVESFFKLTHPTIAQGTSLDLSACELMAVPDAIFFMLKEVMQLSRCPLKSTTHGRQHRRSAPSR